MLLLLAMLAVTRASVAQQSNINDVLNKEIKAIDLRKVTIAEAISHISMENQIPIGVETIFEREAMKADISLANATLKDGLNILSVSFPGYRWSQVDGVIIFSPIVVQDSFLDVVVDRYQTNDVFDLDLRRSITRIPEVAKKIKEMGVEPFHLSIGSFNGRIMRKNFSLSLRHVTARRILNELAKNSFNKYWILTRGGENGELVFLYL